MTCFRIAVRRGKAAFVSILEKPDQMLLLLSAQHGLCCSAQVRGGHSFTKLQMLQESHLAPEHTHINHQPCLRVRGVSKSTLPPPWCTAKAAPAFDKRSIESISWNRHRVNSWLTSFSPRTPPHNTAFSFSLWKQREKKTKVLSQF